MTETYYDAVVLGMELGPLTAGALLARRGFRVLVIGQNNTRDTYPCLGYRFLKRPFRLTGFTSPVLSHIAEELSIEQQLLHLTEDVTPRYQVVLPNVRIDVCTDPNSTRVHIEREIPTEKGRVDSILREIGRLSGDFEKMMQRPLVIPPETFFENRNFSRTMVQNPFWNTPKTDLFEYLQVTGDLRTVLEAPVTFDSATNHLLPMPCARQLGSWLFDAKQFKDGRDGLRKLLCDRIIGNGGTVQESFQIREIVVRRGRVTAVRMVGQDELTITPSVLTSSSPSELSTLIDPGEWTPRFAASAQRRLPQKHGYACNLGMKAEVVPQSIGNVVFFRTSPTGLNEHLLRIERIPQDDPARIAFHVACIVEPENLHRVASGALRDAILDRMRKLLPFLDNYLEVIHSPFDAFGPIRIDTDITEPKSPPHFPPNGQNPIHWHIYPPSKTARLGIENLPHRTGIKGLLLSGDQVVSGLAVEGEFLAGFGAANIAEKMDPTRQRFIRSIKKSIEW